VVFGLALMLDELSLHVRDVSDEVRSGAVRCSQLLSRSTS
jgi:hypothetical protein